jgi:hypothetical protein
MVWGMARYEFRMAIKRWGVWLAFALAGALVVNGMPALAARLASGGDVWAMAGQVAFICNVWLPLVAGIALADRLPRERQLATLELLRSTAASRGTIVAGKYLGGLAAVSFQVLCVVAVGAAVVVWSGGPARYFAAAAAAFISVNLPPLAFVAAFSIACPSVLPVRVYQVLFTGYWFWGNFLNPKAMPTISDTILVASGLPQASAFFNAGFGHFTRGYAVLNLATLAACAGIALVALAHHLRWQDQRA